MKDNIPKVPAGYDIAIHGRAGLGSVLMQAAVTLADVIERSCNPQPDFLYLRLACGYGWVMGVTNDRKVCGFLSVKHSDELIAPEGGFTTFPADIITFRDPQTDEQFCAAIREEFGIQNPEQVLSREQTNAEDYRHLVEPFKFLAACMGGKVQGPTEPFAPATPKKKPSGPN